MQSCVWQCHKIGPFRLQMLQFHRMPCMIHTKRNHIHNDNNQLSVMKTRKYLTHRRTAASCNTHDILEITERRSANYEPSSWGDYFATYAAPNVEPEECVERRIGDLKKEVSEMLKSTTNIIDIMNLVDTILHLGIGYHFDKEIHDALSYLHDTELDSDDLHHVALRFRLLRQNGFYASSDVICKFKDSQGNFDEKLCGDGRALLSLYNAAYLAFPGETILDEAISFARCHLISMVNDLNSPLKRQVLRALKRPLHRMVPRVESMYYIEEYGEEETMNDILLKLAKLDYNLVQRLHLKELKDLSLWWEEFNVAENYKYARDRLIENYIWALAFYYEPQYSRARVMLTKYFTVMTVMDDTFDVYGTFEECKLLNDAIQRWDENEIDDLPMYLRKLYLKFVNTFNGFWDELQPSEKYRASFFIEQIKIAVVGYMQEVEWRNKKEVPTFNNRTKTSIDGYIGTLVVGGPLMGMGEEVTEEIIKWLMTFPDIVMEPMKICRYSDDVISFEREYNAGQGPTTVGCYMHEHGLTKDETVVKFHSMVDESWKRVNLARVQSTNVPVQILDRMVNFARVSEIDHIDGFNYVSQSKELYGSLFLKPFASINEN